MSTEQLLLELENLCQLHEHPLHEIQDAYWCTTNPQGYDQDTLFREKHRFLIGKGKAVFLQAWSGPAGSRQLRFPVFTKTAQDGGKVVNLMHQPPLPPGNTPGTHFR